MNLSSLLDRIIRSDKGRATDQEIEKNIAEFRQNRQVVQSGARSIVQTMSGAMRLVERDNDKDD